MSSEPNQRPGTAARRTPNGCGWAKDNSSLVLTKRSQRGWCIPLFAFLFVAAGNVTEVCRAQRSKSSREVGRFAVIR